MPFVSALQRKKCFVEYNKAIAAGKVPSWDCHKFAHDKKQVTKKKDSIKTKTTRK